MFDRYELLINVLKNEPRYISDEDGTLLKNQISEDAYKHRPELIQRLYNEEKLREWFFGTLPNGIIFFKSEQFSWVINNKEFLPHSYTRFAQTIGLSFDNDHLIKQNHDIVLSFPFKECILEGGQTKKDAKRDETFYNCTLHPDKVNSLMEPKLMINAIKHEKKSKTTVSKINPTDNLIIKGNNLLALSSLLKRYRGKIKCIYIDPPYYFSAKKSEDTFNYNSNFKLSTWLVFMKNRLEIARELLSEEGSIFVQISDDGVAELHILLKEIFNRNGENNFINKITVKTKSPSGFASVNPGVFETAEYILAFAKNKRKWKYNTQYIESSYDTNYKWCVINKTDPYNNWIIEDLANIVAKSLSYPSKKEAINEMGDELFESKIGQYALNHSDSVFRYTTINDDAGAEVIRIRDESKKTNAIYKVDRSKQYDVYITKGQEIAFYSKKIRNIDGKMVPSIQVSNIWTDTPYEGIAKEGNVTLKGGKKPEKLIKRIIEMASKEGDIILDYFMGSGTTCAVAHKLKRQYIGIDQLDYGENDSIVRLDGVINGDKTGISKAVKWVDGGSFISCELASLNQKYIDKLLDKNVNYNSIFQDLINSPFISESLSKSLLNENTNTFSELSDEDKIKIIMEIIDYNELYVNYSDLYDKVYEFDEKVISFNKSFYGDE